jgi:NAD(P)-dependent dehydrogenase (short-subunit alcohol dehydrogenase family)
MRRRRRPLLQFVKLHGLFVPLDSQARASRCHHSVVGEQPLGENRAGDVEVLRHRGCVVNLASLPGLGGDPKMTIYNAAKGAVVNLTPLAGGRARTARVRVNAVAPSLTPPVPPRTFALAHDQKAVIAGLVARPELHVRRIDVAIGQLLHPSGGCGVACCSPQRTAAAIEMSSRLRPRSRRLRHGRSS